MTIGGISGISGNIGRGLAAGLAGTVAMTVSSTVEMKLRGRAGSSAPADAASAVLGVKPIDDHSQERFNNIVHWSYGTGWGAARGVLDSLGLGPVSGFVAHLGAVWATEQVVLPATGAAPPATEWGAEEIAIDLLHHVVYAAATGLAFAWLRRH